MFRIKIPINEFPIIQFSISPHLLDYNKIIMEIYEKDKSFVHILVFFLSSITYINIK